DCPTRCPTTCANGWECCKGYPCVNKACSGCTHGK
uniref:Conotoxin de13a n=1 Tax=Conasprella delessertii TaxID=2547900 RepID=CDA_CONDE|nr:RecName: Full=Conotoxin de13a; Flags: Precursor [Conasprella delessertii]